LIVQGQQRDTLQTATITGTLLRAHDSPTSSDSLLLQNSTAANYLIKDARYQIRQYAPGSVITSNFGGANSSQSTILWDGIDLSSAASGVLDLSLVPAIMLQQNSLIEGSSAGSVGVNGMAGALNLSFDVSGKREFSTLLNTDNIGGFGIGVVNGGHFGKVKYKSYLNSVQSENAYPYSLGGIGHTMEGMSYSQLTFMQKYAGKYKRSNWSTDIWYTSSEKYNRGSVLSSSLPSLLEDEVLRAKYTWQKRRHKLTVMGAREWQSYTDTLGSLEVLDTNSYEQLTAQYRFVHQKRNTAVDWSYFNAGGTSRDAQNVLITLRHQEVLNANWRVNARLGSFLGKVYPAGQVLWQKQKNQRSIQWSLGSFYRLPTLNELYWQPGGNEALRPERSYGAKWSISGQWKEWDYTFSADQLIVDNLIQWLPLAGTVWSPQNFKRVFLSTQNLQLSRRFGAVHSVSSLNQQYTRVMAVEQGVATIEIGKALIYRPTFQAVETVEYRWEDAAIQLRAHAVGSRHTLRDNHPSGELGPEFWMDLTYVQTYFNGLLQSSVGIQNITNSERTYFPYFPMPGRFLTVNLKLSSKK